MRLRSMILIVLLGSVGMALAQEQTPASTPQAGDTRTDEFGIEQVYVPAGCFMMGTSDEQMADLLAQDDVPSWIKPILPAEQPQHEVCITQGFWIDKYEVTRKAYQAFVDDGGYTTEAYWSKNGWYWVESRAVTAPQDCDADPQEDHPQVCINWYEAEAYARWRGGSLPTEAQWEYAARGPEALIYPWGNDWDAALANVTDSAGLKPVGSYPDGVSWVGAHDMAGNAMEWVNDWLDRKYYEKSPKDDPTGPEKGTIKPEKGGWWGSNPFVARSAYKHFEDPPSYSDHHIGFRIVTAAE